MEEKPKDALYGMRAHCWVLIKAGKREVEEDFFIEPSTGMRCEMNDVNYLGVCFVGLVVWFSEMRARKKSRMSILLLEMKECVEKKWIV